MRLAGGASGDRDDRGWDAGPIRRARPRIVNRATRFVVAGTGIAGLVANDRCRRAHGAPGVGQPARDPRPRGAGRDRLGVPAAHPAQRGSRDDAPRRGVLRHRCPPLASDGGDGRVLARHRGRTPLEPHGLRQVHLQPRPGDALGRHRHHDVRDHQQRGPGRDRAERSRRSSGRCHRDGSRRTARREPGHLGQ